MTRKIFSFYIPNDATDVKIPGYGMANYVEYIQEEKNVDGEVILVDTVDPNFDKCDPNNLPKKHIGTDDAEGRVYYSIRSDVEVDINSNEMKYIDAGEEPPYPLSFDISSKIADLDRLLNTYPREQVLELGFTLEEEEETETNSSTEE